MVLFPMGKIRYTSNPTLINSKYERHTHGYSSGVYRLCRAFFKKLPVGGGGGRVHKGPFGYDRRDQKIVGYADIVSIFIIE